MFTDEELGELMKQATEELSPPINPMIIRAERRGKRLRRHRFAWIAGGNAVAVTAIAAALATVTLPGGSRSPASGSGPGGQAASGARGHSHPDHQVRPHPEAFNRVRPHHKAFKETGPAASHKAEPPMTAPQMLAVLRSLLPAGSVFTDVSTTTTPGSLEVNYNDGQGKVDIMVDITPFSSVKHVDQRGVRTMHGWPAAGQVLALTCPHPLWADEGPRPAGALPISCEVRKLADGSIERDAVMYADEFGFYGYGLYDQRPDSVQVSIQVANGYFDPYLPHADRARPPGTMSLWEQVVESPLWRA